jgi:hypothetical protein
MAETTERGPGSPLVDAWHQMQQDLGMNERGHYTIGMECLNCGKQLNADGNHPAETYAGTWNGLCYGCTKAPAFVARIAVLDHAREVSWPPSSPSHRRDRETVIAYRDCTVCGGWGVTGYERERCRACGTRYSTHPLRVRVRDYNELLMTTAQAVFTRRRKAYAKVPGRCSYRRECELLATIPEDVNRVMREEIMRRYRPMRARSDARAARLQVGSWRPVRPGDDTSFGERSYKRQSAA